jgi:hypothetical protein
MSFWPLKLALACYSLQYRRTTIVHAHQPAVPQASECATVKSVQEEGANQASESFR